MSNFWGAHHKYRGRGPTDTSSAQRDAEDVGRGRSGAKRNGVPRTPHTRTIKKRPTTWVDLFHCLSQEVGGTIRGGI